MGHLPRALAAAVVAVGVALVAVGAVNLQRANEGLRSLDAVYTAQDVQLSYNDQGQLIDRGTTDEADAIMSLLVDDWQYPVVDSDLDPADPLVNTPTELMFQYATIAHHVLHGTQTIDLDEAVDYNGEIFEPGSYEFNVDGRYWTQFDRLHPIEGPARSAAWEGAHGILASISSGVAADYSAGFAHFAAWRTMLVGLGFILAGSALLIQKSNKPAATSDQAGSQEPHRSQTSHRDAVSSTTA